MRNPVRAGIRETHRRTEDDGNQILDLKGAYDGDEKGGTRFQPDVQTGDAGTDAGGNVLDGLRLNDSYRRTRYSPLCQASNSVESPNRRAVLAYSRPLTPSPDRKAQCAAYR